MAYWYGHNLQLHPAGWMGYVSPPQYKAGEQSVDDVLEALFQKDGIMEEFVDNLMGVPMTGGCSRQNRGHCGATASRPTSRRETCDEPCRKTSDDCSQACPMQRGDGQQSKSKPTCARPKSDQTRKTTGACRGPSPKAAENDKKPSEQTSTPTRAPPVNILQHCMEQFQKLYETHNSQWFTTTTLRGFSPEQLTVKVDGNIMTIHAVHESGNSEGFDRREAARHIEIPASVDPDSIRVWKRPNGTLVIAGHKFQPKDQQSDEEANVPSNERASGSKDEEAEGPSEDVEPKTAEATGESDVLQKGLVSEDTDDVVTEAVAENKDEKECSAGDQSVPVDMEETEDDPKSSEDDKVQTSNEAEPVSPDQVSDDVSVISSDNEDFADISKFVVVKDPQIVQLEPFSVNVDVSDFAPDELSVKVSGNKVTITGVHESEQEVDGCLEVRRFQRSYVLPSHVDTEMVKSSLSKDGTITVTAPVAIKEHQEKTLPIEQVEASE